jgi:hypothetical protein
MSVHAPPRAKSQWRPWEKTRREIDGFWRALAQEVAEEVEVAARTPHCCTH